MSITYKFTLKKIKKSNAVGSPLVLRLFEDYKSKEIRVGYKLLRKEWDALNQIAKNTRSDYHLINTKIDGYKTKIQKILLLHELEGRRITLDDLVFKLKGENSKTKKQGCFIIYTQKVIESLNKSGKAGNALVYSCALNKVKSFAKSETLLFSSISYKFLKDFESSMLSEGIKVNTVSVYLRTIRAIFNRAIKEGCIGPELYPFNWLKIKSEATINRQLTIDEIKRLVSYREVNEAQDYWRKYFILSFCLIGMNMTDLLTLKKENIDGERIIFRRAKTGKIYSIKIHPYTRRILDTLMNSSNQANGYLLPEVCSNLSPVAQKKRITQVLKNCNKHLKGIAYKCLIAKPITTYYARYTWANIARQQGYSKDMIAEALGHEYGNKVTGIYLDEYDTEKIDEMNSRVIEVVLCNN